MPQTLGASARCPSTGSVRNHEDPPIRGKRAVVVTNVDITRNYGGNLVIVEALALTGWAVTVIGPFDDAKQTELRSVADIGVIDTSINVRITGRSVNRKLDRVRRRLSAIKNVIGQIRSADLIVCAEIRFSGIVAVSRVLGITSAKVIQTCGEFYGSIDGASTIDRIQYRLSSKIWDGLVDVDNDRLELRVADLGIVCPTIVVPNTLKSNGERRTQAVSRSTPVLAYVGQPNVNADLESLAESLALVDEPFEMVCVLFGKGSEVERAQSMLRRALGSKVTFRPPMSKSELSKFLADHCDVGLVHYPPRSMPTLAQEFCAPGKVFDFLALGIPVVTSANKSLQRLVVDYPFGFAAAGDSCAGFGEAAVAALRAVRSGSIDRELIVENFDRAFSSKSQYPKVLSWIDEILLGAVEIENNLRR
jgi:glycosyltransferase involved in cell wall biosynthesis